MLKKEFEYYVNNQDKLVNLFKDKYIVIVGQEVVKSYDDLKTAYLESKKLYKPGTFLIQHCQAGVENYTITYHSRITF